MNRKKPKPAPLTPEEVEALTTLQHMRRARDFSQYWQKRSDGILKLANPTPGQLEAQPWYEQHCLVWGAIAEKLEALEIFQAQDRARNYDLANQN